MKRKRKMMIETFVAIGVLSVLSLVMLPRYMDAQIRLNVATAIRDLNVIVKAMVAYNVNESGHGVQSVHVSQFWNDPGPAHIRVTTLELRTRNVSRLVETELPPERLSPYIRECPIPHLPKETEVATGPVDNPYYVVSRREKRLQNPIYTSGAWWNGHNEILSWLTFYGGMEKAEYAGISQGPIGWPYTWKNQSFGPNNRWARCIKYDPTNGIKSHGLLVVQSETATSTQPTPSPRPTPWYPTPQELTANLNSTPKPLTITSVTSLIEYHRSMISTLDVIYQGLVSDNDVTENAFEKIESGSQYRKQAMKGELPDGVTPEEVDRYYEILEAPRTYPVEYTYIYAGDNRQIKIIHSPQITRYPWESIQETILHENCVFSIDRSLKHVFLSDEPRSVNYMFITDYFNPLWFVNPLKCAQSMDKYSCKEQNDGLWRIKWNARSGDDNFFTTIDCLIDLSAGCLPRKTLMVRPNVRSSESLDVWYAESDRYKAIDGVLFPTQLTVFLWKQYSENRANNRILSRKGYYKGFDVPDILGGATVPEPIRKWEFSLIIAKINQPVDEDRFWPAVPEGYHYQDSRRFLRNRLRNRTGLTDEQYREIAGEGPHTFKPSPEIETTEQSLFRDN